uniref:Uncharacterized protein n=1 Tax=Chrysemys picta bellii TaxID=8478 RepID=A0A8C3HJI1_CHRPI
MSASDRVVVVLGGAGTVGSGIVKSLLERGFRVVVVSRDGARLEKLQSFVPAPTRDRLHTLIGDVGSEEGAEAAKEALLKSVGKVTDVVSSLGFSWWQGGPPPHSDAAGASAGPGNAVAEHFYVLESVLPSGPGEPQRLLHLHHRRGWRASPHARHRVPDAGGCGCTGLLPGGPGGVPRRALQAE